MSYLYDQRKRPQGQQSKEPEQTTAPGPGIDALMSGTRRPQRRPEGKALRPGRDHESEDGERFRGPVRREVL